TVTVTSNSPALATITRDGTVVGGASVTFTNVTSTNVGTVFVQGRALGTTTLTAQAAGYSDGTSDVSVDPAGFIINANSFTTTSFSPNTSIRVDASRLNSTTMNYAGTQPLRPGVSASVVITSSNTSAGTVASPLQFNSGDSNLNTAFDPA